MYGIIKSESLLHEGSDSLNKLPKKELEFTSRMEVIHYNFFKYLKERKITQKQFAMDNDVPESTVSKWKQNKICMSEEHIYKAAKYLKIYANDLFYTDDEKKEIDVLSTKAYDPIMAQKQIKVKKLTNVFSNSFETISLGLFVFAFVLIIFFFISKSAHWGWSFLSVTTMIIFYKDFYDKLKVEETFSINYLDDIFYLVDNPKNQYKTKNLVLSSISFLSLVAMFILLILGIVNDNAATTIIVILLLLSLVMIIMCVVTGLCSYLKLKQEIYYYEIIPYAVSLGNLVAIFVYIGFGMWLVFNNIKLNWYYLLPLTVLFITNLLIFLNVSKKYSEYKLVYFNQKDSVKRELYKNVKK